MRGGARTQAEELLQVFDAGKDARCSLAGFAPALHLKQSEVGLQGLTDNRASASQALRLATPWWRAVAYPIAVLCGVLAHDQGMPAVLCHDAFVALLGSLIHNAVAVTIGGCECRSRFRVAGTTETGGGKSAAADPLRDLLNGVLYLYFSFFFRMRALRCRTCF